MLEDMPCGEEQLCYHAGLEWTEAYFLMRNLKGENPSYIPKWFGFAEVDIEIPKTLWKKFEEMPPFFYNKEIPQEAIPQHMKDYLQKNRKKGSKHQKARWGSFCQKNSFVCSTAALVRGTRGGDNSGLPNN